MISLRTGRAPFDTHPALQESWQSRYAAAFGNSNGAADNNNDNVNPGPDGEVNHALRITLTGIQSAYILPATHSDGTCGSDPSCPPMGLRLRLRADFDDSGLPASIQVICRALKRYGIVIADTGGDMFPSGAHDPRWDDDNLRNLTDLVTQDFEAVDTGEAFPY